MKKVLWMFGIAGVGLCLMASQSLAQGSLIPPGAPAPTMKTLMQVEPRIPITELPFTITEAGSYYMTTNLTTTGHGIVVQANQVTVDLMGFEITGDGDSDDYGIWVAGDTSTSLRDVVVRGGMVANFGYGVRFDYAQNSRMEGLTISIILNSGAYLNGSSGQCNGNIIRDCSIRYCGSSGVYLNGPSGECNGNTITDCAISGNSSAGVWIDGSTFGKCDGNAVRNCTVNQNGSAGIQFNGPFGQCDGNTVRDCAVSDNGSSGIYLYGSYGQCNGNLISGSAMSGNNSSGVWVDGSTSGKCNGNTVRDCAIDGNASSGVVLMGLSGECNGNTVRDCNVNDNGYYGIYLEGIAGDCDGNAVSHCVLRKNTYAGIYGSNADGNRIENNHVSGTTGPVPRGILTDSSNANLIFQNTCVGQTDNYIISQNDTYGPILTDSGELSTAGGAAMSPWANFSR